MNITQKLQSQKVKYCDFAASQVMTAFHQALSGPATQPLIYAIA
jgi:hypothetical protein